MAVPRPEDAPVTTATRRDVRPSSIVVGALVVVVSDPPSLSLRENILPLLAQWGPTEEETEKKLSGRR